MITGVIHTALYSQMKSFVNRLYTYTCSVATYYLKLKKIREILFLSVRDIDTVI